jgi:F-type H+-transporting ATPase subunit delta
MTNSAVATRYADAFADVVTAKVSQVTPQNALGEIQAFDSVLRGSPELQQVLATPSVSGSRKRAVIGRISDSLRLSRVTRNFLFVLIDHRRIGALSEIIQTFEQILDERLGFARVEVASAREMSDAQRSALNAELERLTGKRVRARFRIDDALIGGVVARIGSTVYDGSVRGQLNLLERRLTAES